MSSVQPEPCVAAQVAPDDVSNHTGKPPSHQFDKALSELSAIQTRIAEEHALEVANLMSEVARLQDRLTCTSSKQEAVHLAPVQNGGGSLAIPTSSYLSTESDVVRENMDSSPAKDSNEDSDLDEDLENMDSSPTKEVNGDSGACEHDSPEGRPSVRRAQSKCHGLDENNVLDQEIARGKSEFLEHLEINKVLKEDGLGDEINVVDRMVMKLEKTTMWWSSLEEPVRDGCVYRFVESRCFESFCMVIIMLNSFMVAYATDWEMRHILEKEPAFIDAFEKGCIAWFMLELILRLMAHRYHFFINKDMQWNIFDLVLVTISMVDLIVEMIQAVAKSSNVGFMRVLRLLKLARIFRSLRSFRFFNELRVLLDSFQRSFVSLFWGFIMLFFVLYLFSLIFMQALIDYLVTGGATQDQFDSAEEYFGSLGQTLLALYMAVTGGESWIKYYDILASAGIFYGYLLCFFTFFFLFALFNILTGSLVEKAMATSKPDRTEMILRQRQHYAREKQQFLHLCQAMDKDHDGVISWQEFSEWMCNPVILTYMASLGVEIHDVELFFKTCGAREGRGGKTMQQGEIDIEHFVEGCMHMKGTATAIDMQRQLFEMHVLHHDVQHLEHFFRRRFEQLESKIEQNGRCTSAVSTAPWVEVVTEYAI